MPTRGGGPAIADQWNADHSSRAPEAPPALTQTPRYREAPAKLAWERTIAFVKKLLA
jgi:dienelactone hydrolase